MKNHIEITNFNDPNLDLYARLSEVQLLRYAEPKQGIFVAESPKVIGRALQAGYEPISFLLAHQDLDREALRVVKALPDWIPGKQRGVAVDVFYTLPIEFRLQSDAETPAVSGKADEQV